MKKPVLIGGLVAAAAIAAMAIWFAQSNDRKADALSPTATAPTNAAANAPLTAEQDASQAIVEMIPAIPLEAPASDDEDSEDPVKMFSADAAGNLVLKERTRLNVEKILWVYSPEEQQKKLAAIEKTLPPSAYRQLVDLMEHYKNFTTAAKQAYPPDVAPATVEDAIAQHEGLSALRKAHFGTTAAEAMFGREEKLNRQLLEFMNLEKHEGLTMEEKAMKAQELLSKSPELSAAYEQNRREAPQDQ